MNPLDVLVDLECERAILGSSLLEPAAVPLVAELPSALFHGDAHRALADAIRDVASKGLPVEPGTVQVALERAGRWGDIGFTKLAILQESATVTEALSEYITKLRELAARRGLVRLGREAAHRAADLTVPLDALLAGHLKAAADLEDAGLPADVLGPEQIAAEMETLTELPRTATGLWIYDAEGGLTMGDLHVVGARPRMGKTSLGLQVAHHITHTLGLPALFLSAEMDRRQIELRLRNLSTPKQTRASGLRLYDPVGYTVHDVTSLLRREVARHQIEVAVVDHLQTIRASKTREGRRDLEIREIVEGLASAARSLGIAILALCQLNREIERRQTPVPMLSDLRDGGAIEELAATVTFLYSDPPGAEDGDDATIPAQFVQRKNRHEPARKWRAQFLRPTRFEGMA